MGTSLALIAFLLMKFLFGYAFSLDGNYRPNIILYLNISQSSEIGLIFVYNNNKMVTIINSNNKMVYYDLQPKIVEDIHTL